jgi:hypothetical protein
MRLVYCPRDKQGIVTHVHAETIPEAMRPVLTEREAELNSGQESEGENSAPMGTTDLRCSMVRKGCTGPIGAVLVSVLSDFLGGLAHLDPCQAQHERREEETDSDYNTIASASACAWQT